MRPRASLGGGFSQRTRARFVSLRPSTHLGLTFDDGAFLRIAQRLVPFLGGEKVARARHRHSLPCARARDRSGRARGCVEGCIARRFGFCLFPCVGKRGTLLWVLTRRMHFWRPRARAVPTLRVGVDGDEVDARRRGGASRRVEDARGRASRRASRRGREKARTRRWSDETGRGGGSAR